MTVNLNVLNQREDDIRHLLDERIEELTTAIVNAESDRLKERAHMDAVWFLDSVMALLSAVVCPECEGSRMAYITDGQNGYDRELCDKCNGSGLVAGTGKGD